MACQQLFSFRQTAFDPFRITIDDSLDRKRITALATDLQTLVDQLEENISRVVLGKSEVVRLCVVALLAGEHVLLEDVPGVGKTLVAKAMAKSISAGFTRIQFTPDLLPSDIIGTSVYDAQAATFNYVQGPIFANLVLADEINRTTPRTQSALLEAMSEGQISVDSQTHQLPQPFMVIATQNPFEFEGTYPLPESQLDRFLMRISMGYPDRQDELDVLASHRSGEPIEDLQSVLDTRDVLALQQAVRDVSVDETINEYILDIVEATRNCEELHVGASTRGALSLSRACQSLALVEGREFVVPDDVKRLSVPVLSHRVLASGHLHAGHRQVVESLIQRLVDEVQVPS